MVVALLMTPTLLVSFLYHEGEHSRNGILVAILITFLLGRFMSWVKPSNPRIYIREGLVITSLCWLFLSLVGALPFYMSGSIPHFVDAFFESASGFTTTGSSILTDIESLPHSVLFWRSFTHFIGGMGVLVFALAVLPDVSGQSVHLMKAEVPGPTFGKLVSRLKDTARILYVIYAAFTLVLAVLLMAAGLNLFDALIHAMGTAGTGGFSSYNTSINAFHSPLVEYILTGGMILFGINFYLYYSVLRGRVGAFFRDEELRFYLLIIAMATALIMINVHNQYDNIFTCFRQVIFTVASIMTTTGYSTADFEVWPVFSKVVLLLLMFIGGCGGSTAGGLKVGRTLELLKISRAQIRQATSPRRITPVLINKKPIVESQQREVGVYLMVYAFAFLFILLMVSMDHVNFETAFGAVAGTFNNVGPGFGAVGPSANFSSLSDFSKLMLSIGMIAGRLEIFPIIILFSPSAWRNG